MRRGASALALLFLAVSGCSADAPTEKPAPKSEDTPEAAVRRMYHAISAKDSKELTDAILPTAEAKSILLCLQSVTPKQQEDWEARLAKPMCTLKPGDTFTRTDGKEYRAKSLNIGPDKALVFDPDMNIDVPWHVVRTKRGWRVDWRATFSELINDDSQDWGFDEIARVTSPSGELDAVMIETDGGFTISLGYEIYLVPKGEKAVKGGDVAVLYAARRSKSALGANLRWEKDSLVVEYLTAKHEEQKSDTVTVDGEKVRVLLKPGVEDLSAPEGDMLYNKNKPKQP